MNTTAAPEIASSFGGAPGGIGVGDLSREQPAIKPVNETHNAITAAPRTKRPRRDSIRASSHQNANPILVLI
jgi:hypothetical protein